MASAGVENAAQKKLLHIFFFPFMTPGHFMPMVDMARLFAQRPGVKVTIVTTPGNAPAAKRTIDRANAAAAGSRPAIDLLLVPFPHHSQTGLPEGKENLSAVPSSCFTAFLGATFLFRDPLDRLLREHRPHCLVSDSLFTWTADLAEDAGIPRLLFHGAGAFPLYVMNELGNLMQLIKGEEEGDGTFILPGLPHPIRLTKSVLPELMDNITMCQLLKVAEGKSYGIVINTFREMEPTYTDYLKGNKRTWCVGPVSLCNVDDDDKAVRGADGNDSAGDILRWLDGQEHQSVLYVCFGSLCDFSTAQLAEIALGLEGSGHPFLWVMKAQGCGPEQLPEGFEERMAGRGLVVRGWAPQVAVLAHPATGCFVTHCGWNSLQEAVCAGVPMITWPLFHEQFINEILLVEVMGVGTRMWEGVRRNRLEEHQVLVRAEEIARKVTRVMGGGVEAEEERKTARCMGKKAKDYAEMASRVLEEGGSTYEDISRLLDELRLYQNKSDALPAATPARNPIRAFFFPFFATGHIIPQVDVARMLAERGGIECTVVVTPANAAIVRPILDRAPHLPIRILLYPFPSAEVGLPEGCENIATVSASDAEKVYRAVALVRDTHDRILRLNRPDCVIADTHFHWTTNIARDLSIPRLSFTAIGLFPMEIMHWLGDPSTKKTIEYRPDGSFIVPGLPDPPIVMFTSELPDFLRGDDIYLNDVMADIEKAEIECYGVVVNTFYELEGAYAELKKKRDTRKIYCVGPMALHSQNQAPEPAPEDGCLAWLGGQKAGSVVYVCFGSWCHLSGEQLREMARGLGASGHPFLWVVREDQGVDLEKEAGRRGLVVRGWAPQVAILNHPAVGAFMTHCGWNSLLEGTSAGLPMLTWPLVFEQFMNERLVLQVLRTGVRVWDGPRGTREEEAVLVPGEALAKAVGWLMGGEEEAGEIRRRAREYGERARAAVEEGGSSLADLDRMIADLKAKAASRE